MEDKQKQQAGPVDIPDAEAPRQPAPRPKAAAKPAAAKKQSPAGKKPAAKKKPVKRPVKKAAPPEDDLPPWLGKIVDWVADIPDKLRKLPGKFVSLWGSWFYRVYFPLVGLALILIFFGWNWLGGFARDYEAAQPVHVADEVTQIFTTGDYDRIYELDTEAQALSGGDRAFYVDSLSRLAAGRTVDCIPAFSSDKNEMKYNITLDGTKFATFTLVPNGQTTAHGNTLWQLGTVTTNVVLESTVTPADPNQAPYRIQALPEYTVTVNGRTLTAEDVTRTGIPTLPDNFLPRGITAPTLTEYGFYSEEGAPRISVTAADGTALTPVEESQNIWVCGLREDEALKSQYSESIIKMAQRIAKYTTQDTSRNNALSGVWSNSPAEEIIKKFNNGWAPSHKEESFENMEVSQFAALTDECLVCHVTFDYILTSKRENDYTYPTEYTFCIVRRNGDGKLYNLLFH